MSTAKPATKSHPSSSIEGEKKLLYTVLQHRQPPYLYELYAFELTGNQAPDQQLPAPVLKLDFLEYPYGMAFFSSGPKIYMVGGSFLNKKKINGRTQIEGGSKDMHIYDTLTGSLRIGPPMPTGKGDDTIVVTPPVAGKYYIVGFEKFTGLSIEAFNVDSESWSGLSPCPFFSTELLQEYPCDFSIDAYSVVGNKVVLSVFRCYSHSDTTSRGVVMYIIDEDVWEIVVDESVELPFHGPALYAENDGWIGLCIGRTRGPRNPSDGWIDLFNGTVRGTRGSTDVCGFKVTDCFRFSQRRRLLNVVDPNEFSHSKQHYLVNMGDKKFCVVRTGNVAGFMGQIMPVPLKFWTNIVVLEISTQLSSSSSSSSSSGWKATKQLSSSYWTYGECENFGMVIAAFMI